MQKARLNSGPCLLGKECGDPREEVGIAAGPGARGRRRGPAYTVQAFARFARRHREEVVPPLLLLPGEEIGLEQISWGKAPGKSGGNPREEVEVAAGPKGPWEEERAFEVCGRMPL
jgi:hypothetical protein